MSYGTVDQNQLKELILESLAEILKDEDKNISVYEDVLLGKIMDQDRLESPKLIDANTLKKSLKEIL